MYTVLEIIGTVAFAVSGAMVAIGKKMDILGVLVLGVTTAIGGGIIRDILMGKFPPESLRNPLYAFIAIGVSLLVFLPFLRKRINVDHLIFVLIDALGLGTFTVIGIETASGLDNAFLQVFLGVLTGVGGGVLRDLFATRPPVIFVKHFYATASLIGAVACVLLYPLSKEIAMIAGIVLILLLRVLAARFRWHLPKSA